MTAEERPRTARWTLDCRLFSQLWTNKNPRLQRHGWVTNIFPRSSLGAQRSHALYDVCLNPNAIVSIHAALEALG